MNNFFSVVSMVAVNIPLLISSLFPVPCSDLSLQSSLFFSPVVLSSWQVSALGNPGEGTVLRSTILTRGHHDRHMRLQEKETAPAFCVLCCLIWRDF